MTRRNSLPKGVTAVSLATRSVVESLERRVHLSYDNRGKISVIVDEDVAPFLRAQLAEYKRDLIGDGWIVSMHDGIEADAAPRMNDDENVWDHTAINGSEAIPSTTTPYRNDLQTVKDMIAADFHPTPANQTPTGLPPGQLGMIVIVGHVTVPYSGLTNYDGHDWRAMPTDQYYADLDGTPGTWGDSAADYVPTGVPAVREFTPNRPGDGRFDAYAVPGDARTITVSGSGRFKVTVTYRYTDLHPDPPVVVTTTSTTDWLPTSISAADLRDAMNALPAVRDNKRGPIEPAGSVSVVRNGNVFEVRFLGENGGGDYLPVDFTAGSPVPADGLTFTGGDGTDVLYTYTWNGDANAPDTATYTPSQITFNGSKLYQGDVVEGLWFYGAGGFDNVTVSGGMRVRLHWDELATLDVGDGSFAELEPGANATLRVDDLELNSSGTLDLADNDLIVYSSAKSAVESKIAQARNTGTGGLWTGTGITSTAAGGIRGLGVLSGAEYNGFHANHLFNDNPVASGDVVVKFTYNGDATLSGTVAFDDYVRIDIGFNTQLTGWSNGDFNYSGGFISFDDYVLIDTAFNTQGGAL